MEGDMHEKRGVIEPGRTPPEQDDEKQASEGSLEDHVGKRAADAITDAIPREAIVFGEECGQFTRRMIPLAMRSIRTGRAVGDPSGLDRVDFQ
jgi:hypothetical protein